MLDHMSDEQKITVTAKLAQEVLSAAIDGGLPLASSSAASANSSSAFASGSKKSASAEARKKASAVVKDALTIMASPGIRVGAGRGGAAAAGDADDGSGNRCLLACLGFVCWRRFLVTLVTFAGIASGVRCCRFLAVFCLSFLGGRSD